MISFHSIHTAMTMLLIGCKVNSKSHSELVKALYSTENTELTKSVLEDFLMNYKLLLSYYKKLGGSNITLNLANNAYVNKRFQIKEAYTEALKSFFETGEYYNYLCSNSQTYFSQENKYFFIPITFCSKRNQTSNQCC